MKRTTYIWYFWVLLLMCFSSCSPKEERRVLVIHSYEDSYAAYPVFNQLIIDEFRKNGIRANLCVLYLDCESYLEEDELSRMNFLLDSIKSWSPEVILVNEDQATYSLLKSNHPLSKQIPIVFSGVNYPNWDLLKQFPNVTGFHDKLDIKANVEMAKKLFGPKINLFSLLDNTYIDNKIKETARQQLKDEKIVCMQPPMSTEKSVLLQKAGYTFYTAVPVRTTLNQKDAGLMWSLSKYSKNRCYLQVKRDFTTVNISNITASPSLTAINEGFEFKEKLLGGYFTPLPTQVKESVSAATQILQGRKPIDIPVKESAKEHLVDWKIVDLLNIPADGIPAEYTVINTPFREKYAVLWLAFVVLCSTMLASLIFCLAFLYRREQKRKKRALLALADEKETLALAVEGGTTYVWKLEGDYFIFESNFWQSLGIKEQKLTIDKLIALIHPDHKESFLENWKKLSSAHKEIVQIECDFNQKGYQWWEFRYTTSRLATGENRTAGLLLNIQAFKERELELERASMLAEKAELKESFLANMSHEIRTPLNAIVGFSTMLTSGEEFEEEEKQDFMNAIQSNNQLLLKLIGDILELSRIKSGYMSFTFETCRMDAILDNIFTTHQMLVPTYLEFLREDGQETLEVNIDKSRFTQVITNFINNACKFTQEGYIKIGYRYIPEQEEVEVFVEDSGQGIALEEQKMIFSRFYKHNEFAQGTGLGLSICQGIIEKLNGRIELWSEPGKGSRFTVILPCKVVF